MNIDEFSKSDLRVGTIKEGEKVEGSNKLLRFQIDIGEETPRQILSGIGAYYNPEDLIGRQVVIIANLEPRMMMGFESKGMILAAENESGPVLLGVDKEVMPGSKIH